jgi:hypothetical protein
MLTAENITSYFVAAKDPEAGEEYYGLLSMAELILLLKREPIQKADYIDYLKSLSNDGQKEEQLDAVSKWESDLDEKVAVVELSVVRFAGGEPAGAHGILELFKNGSETSLIFDRKGLVFVPSADRRRTKQLGTNV